MVTTVQFVEAVCNGDIVVRDIKQQISITLSPLQNFQLFHYALSEEPYTDTM